MWVSTLKYNPELWTTTAEAKSRIRRRSLETTEDQTKETVASYMNQDRNNQTKMNWDMLKSRLNLIKPFDGKCESLFSSYAALNDTELNKLIFESVQGKLIDKAEILVGYSDDSSYPSAEYQDENFAIDPHEYQVVDEINEASYYSNDQLSEPTIENVENFPAASREKSPT
ncbi:hypothetical protein HUJ05_001752 [Dendroctonus ponderosae]|nr:hypothetical protein HUJ05_001752 [Dendroctonus ponderosae]